MDRQTPRETPGPTQRTQYLTAPEVAKWLGTTEQWVYRMSRTGGMPTIRKGRYIRFVPDEIEAWMSEPSAA